MLSYPIRDKIRQVPRFPVAVVLSSYPAYNQASDVYKNGSKIG